MIQPQNANSRLEQKEKMLALSHDMKAPSMRALYALREVQHVSSVLNEEHQHLLSEIEYALEEQMGMIHSLFSLDSSEDSSGTNVHEIEIASMVKNRVESFKVVARAASISLSIARFDRAKVRISREVLYRIVDNLLTNAIKYTSEGEIEISIHALRDNKIEISVKDSGKGVPERLQTFLFSNEIRKLEREVNSGHGYGLSVVKKIS